MINPEKVMTIKQAAELDGIDSGIIALMPEYLTYNLVEANPITPKNKFVGVFRIIRKWRKVSKDQGNYNYLDLYVTLCLDEKNIMDEQYLWILFSEKGT